MTSNDQAPTTVFLLRHGQTANTVDGRFRYNGHLDVEVTPESLRQMAAIAEQLAAYPVSRVFSSDLRRSRAGAAVIAARLRRPHVIVPEFREIRMGLWEGLTYEEVRERYPDDLRRKFADFINYRIPGGETIPEVEKRLFGKLDELLAAHRGEHLVIVAHGGVNMLCLCRALRLPATDIFRFKQDFCCINQLEYYHDFSKICLMNSPCLPPDTAN
ncbi:MAG: histidine phosphatase family protein [Deltaproteobacteria bacterium]|nr:histidine phosphatase family protein [Deltaproteobacteria bacterium]